MAIQRRLNERRPNEYRSKRGRDSGELLRRRMERVLRRARRALLIERVWPPIAAFLVVSSVFFGITFLGVWQQAPAWIRWPALLVFVASAAWVLRPLVRRGKAAAPIDRAATIARVETASRLRHQPLAALEDNLTQVRSPDQAETQALWRAHRERVRDQVENLKAGAPNPRFFAVDQYVLRVVGAILLVCGLVVGHGDYGPRLASILVNTESVDTALRVDIWVNPPTYTNRPPLVLSHEARLAAGSLADAVEVPEGSEIIIRIQGDPALIPTLDQGSGPRTLEIDADDPGGSATFENAPRTFTDTLDADAVLAISDGDVTTASWTLSVLPDLPPTIALTSEPAINPDNTIRYEYELQDDHGIAGATANYQPVDDHVEENARLLVASPDHALSLPANRSRTGTARTVRDLTDHPLAGSKVRVTFMARDLAGKTARSDPIELILPSRIFNEPLARALIEQRRRLALDANRQVQVIEALDALTLAPELFSDDYGTHMGVRLIYHTLTGADTDDALRDILDQLWDLALVIENGDLSEAERDLRDAQEALRRALEEGASDEEIARLTEELGQAMREYLRALARNMQQQPRMGERQPTDGQQVESRELDEMLDRIQELAQSGARDAARQMLAELQGMLDNLRMSRQQMPDGQQGRMDQTMRQLGDIIRQQRELMDQTFRRQRDGQQQQGQGQPDQGMTPDQMAEALRQLQEQQGALAGQLQALREQLGQMGLGEQRGGAFGEAGEAMGRAEGALGEGEPGQAVGPQGQALDALRRGIGQLAEAMRGEGGSRLQPDQQGQANRDPLGRPRRTGDTDFGETTRVPDEIDGQRARRVLRELRRRLSDPTRPRIELDYLERLLERF